MPLQHEPLRRVAQEACHPLPHTFRGGLELPAGVRHTAAGPNWGEAYFTSKVVLAYVYMLTVISKERLSQC